MLGDLCTGFAFQTQREHFPQPEGQVIPEEERVYFPGKARLFRTAAVRSKGIHLSLRAALPPPVLG